MTSSTLTSTSVSKQSVPYPHAPWYFALAMVTTWIGFSTSYFSRLVQTDIYHQVHGIIAGLWMAALIIQPVMHKVGKLPLHPKLGKLVSIVLAALLILDGIKMMYMMIRDQALYPPGATYQLAYIDTYSLVMFLLFFVLSQWYNGRIHLHARYMACTVLTVLPLAITRLLFFIPWFDSFDKNLNASFIAIELVLILLLNNDGRTGKVWKPYKIALLLFVLLHITMNYAPHWPWWKSALDKFAS